MNEYELHDQNYIYRLETNGISKYNKQTKESLRHIPYKIINTVKLEYVPPSRYGGDYYQCTIYYNKEGEKGYFQKKTLSFTNKDDYPEHYINLVKELHYILAEQKVVVRYKVGDWVTSIFSVLMALFVIYAAIRLLSNYSWLILLALLIYFLFTKIPSLFINFPRTYFPDNIPTNLFPTNVENEDINLDRKETDRNKEMDRNIVFNNFRLFIIPIAVFAFVFYLFGEGIYSGLLHKNEKKRSLYNNTDSDIAAIYIEKGENILEQGKILKPAQRVEVWVAVDTLKKKDENSTIKLVFTDSVSYEFRMPLGTCCNGCNFDICINDDGNHGDK
jgi:hypothetical protein